MGPWDRNRRSFSPPASPPSFGVVPSRAALTELARGFLLLHEKDPDRARRFAATFVREQSSETAEESSAKPRLPAVRRSAKVWTLTEPPTSLDVPEP